MASPIAETPVLMGEDAVRFERLKNEVGNEPTRLMFFDMMEFE